MNPVEAVFRRLTLGVYVVGVAAQGQADGFTAAWVMQASFDPLLLALSINRGHASYPLLQAGGSFVVNLLKHEQLDLASRFGTQSGRDRDKLAGVRWRPSRGGAPILEDALGYFDCRLEGSMAAGDHDVVLGRVLDARLLDPKAVPLRYAETGNLDGSSALFPTEL
ncbi:MAG TPA: flavin reductase family protein [Gemmatimonadales bacterium]|jgi:flavin reductase (DIM6/NTAB) family NADH-FMN oxidoreductase RutF|nr:flavin reductase family protein [Gemmatimonadales bacterium]